MPQNSRFGGASVVQKGKRKMQVFGFQALAFCWVPGAAVEIINSTKIILNYNLIRATCKVLKINYLQDCIVPGAAVEIINLTKIILN